MNTRDRRCLFFLGPRWWIVAVYALSMAWVESAVVFYLRTFMDRIEPYQVNPLPEFGRFGLAEIMREAATLVMLGTVGYLAGTCRRSRWAYSLLAFGIWDLGYYVFLKILSGWPHSLADWDILFLIPVPWWGPVWAPCAIAFIMVGLGTLSVDHSSGSLVAWPGDRDWWIALAGAVLALGTFTYDTLQGRQLGVSMRSILPESFATSVFLFGLLAMSLPLIQILRNRTVSNLPVNLWPGLERIRREIDGPHQK